MYGALSSSTYIDTFNYVVPMKSFELHNLPVVSGAMEILAYWSKFPQVDTIDIAESGIKERDVLLLTVNNTMQSKRYFGKDTEDDGWIVKLDAYYRDFNIFYQQALKQFSGSAIQYIRLHALGRWETRSTGENTTIGNSLGYFIDHYTAIKDVFLGSATISSFQAEATGQQLKKLAFAFCQIEPIFFPQLSSSVELINRLCVGTCMMRSGGLFDYKILIIDMSQTAIGDINLHHANNEDNSRFFYLVKVRISSPIQKMCYFKMDVNKVLYLQEQADEQITIDSRDDNNHIEVAVNCRSLQKFSAFHYTEHHVELVEVGGSLHE
ncbi:hypothetical protein HMPREF1544_04711 [Mucor circinelloides 1006PhL]|uniref:Uncharacterized protein n=1 Tax=Mucor circinelloides f. circinelloides (strain 1006PhL) TaxID=1220926 RepID=S2JDY4_MUCC1|nr:hypothetical protein HMPREF1544_04711 [Mucor circinelloides 1006PhL]